MQEQMFCARKNVSSYYGEGEKDIWKAYVRRGMNGDEASATGLGLHGGAMQAIAGGAAAAGGAGGDREYFLARGI